MTYFEEFTFFEGIGDAVSQQNVNGRTYRVPCEQTPDGKYRATWDGHEIEAGNRERLNDRIQQFLAGVEYSRKFWVK